MFNRTNLYRAGDSHTTNKYEMKPHDAADAARLYGEVKDQAEKAIEDVMIDKIESINAEFIKWEKARNPMNFDVHHFVAFKINGKKFAHKITVDEFKEGDKISTVRKIAEDLAEEIVRQLINEHASEL